MKKLQLLSLAVLFLFGSCSKDDEFKGFTEIGVDVATSGDEVVSDVKIHVYDALKENAYVKTIDGSSLTLTDLEASTYKLIALGNTEGSVEGKEDYAKLALVQDVKGEKNMFVAMQDEFKFPAELEKLNFDLQKVTGLLKIKSTDAEAADYDSLSISVVVPKGKYGVVSKSTTGDAVTLTKGFNTDGGVDFEAEFKVFPGTVAVSMEYFKDKNSIFTLDLGTAEVTAAQTVAIEKPFNDEVNRFIEIPDKTLRDILRREIPEAFDANNVFDTKHESVAALETFSAVYKKIEDFTGVQYLIGLTELKIGFNSDAAGTLNLSKMKNLKTCDVSYCSFDAVIVDGLDKMETFNCGGNQLTSLDVSTCTALTYLEFGGNAILKDITLGSLPAVTMLVGYDCVLEGDLDFSGFTALETLYLERNQKITGVNVSGLASLEELRCSANDIKSIKLSGCSALTTLDCGENQLSTLDVSELTNLKELVCNQNFFTSLDLSANSLLEDLSCYNNTLSSINLKGCSALEKVFMNDNKFETIDFSECTALTRLYCYNNSLTALDLSSNAEMVYLDCNNNKLTTLDLSGLANLGTVKCNNNELSELNITNCSSLGAIECTGINQTLIDITGLVVNDYLWSMSIPSSAVCGTNIKAWFETKVSNGDYYQLSYEVSEGVVEDYKADTCQQ